MNPEDDVSHTTIHDDERPGKNASTYDRALQEWNNVSKHRPLRIMVAGLGGAGMSTLVNRLLGLSQEENVAKEGCGGEATTEVVGCHRYKLLNGVEAIIFDTPGFDNPDIDEYRIIADMKLKTEEKLDLLLYCVSVEKRGTRVTNADVRAIGLLTRAFGVALWKIAIFVVTFANMACERMQKDEYSKLISTIEEKLRTNLHEKARVPMDIVSKIPLTTAGFTDPVIRHEQEYCKDWTERLYGLLLQRNPKIAPKLLKGIFTKEDFLDILGYGLPTGEAGRRIADGVANVTCQSTAVGGIVGAAVGAVVGGIVGVARPFGAAFGAAVGTAIGARILGGVKTGSATAGLVGAAVGGMIGAMGGPFGAALGAAVGTTIGARVLGVFGIGSGSVGAAVGGIVGAVAGQFGPTGVLTSAAIGGMVGAAVGGIVGATVDGPVGVARPFGAALGAAVGTAIGARKLDILGGATVGGMVYTNNSVAGQFGTAGVGAVVGAVSVPFAVATVAAIGIRVLGVGIRGNSAGVVMWNTKKISDRVKIFWQKRKLQTNQQQLQV